MYSEVPTARATPMSPSHHGDTPESRVVTAPAGSKEGDMVEVENGERVMVPEGVQAGESFVVAEPAPVVATPVQTGPTDEDIAREIQRAELAHVNGPIMLNVSSGLYGAGHPHLSLGEQKVLNYKWSIKCFALFDLFGTLLLTVYGSWALIAVFFVIGPIFGYLGAKNLQHRKISIYLSFCLLKTLYVVLFVVFGSILAIFVLIIQLWVTNIVYKFWRLLGSVSPERVAQLNDPAYNVRLHFLYY